MDEHKKFLADRILSEERPVSLVYALPGGFGINPDIDHLSHIEPRAKRECQYGKGVRIKSWRP